MSWDYGSHTYSCTTLSLIGLKSTSLMLFNFVVGNPPHFTFNPSAFSTILRHTHFSGQLTSANDSPLHRNNNNANKVVLNLVIMFLIDAHCTHYVFIH